MDKQPTMEAYAELQAAYEHFNRELFDARLPPCLITLQRAKRSYGYFSARQFARRDGTITDEIALNPGFFGVVPICESLSTLVHEMTHLWQHHFGKPGRARYHNAEWADTMERIGLMPSATGQPGAARVGEHMSHYIVEGGPFSQAADQLLTTDFQISWFDRFPPIAQAPALIGPPPPPKTKASSKKKDESAQESVAAPPRPADQITSAQAEAIATMIEQRHLANGIELASIASLLELPKTADADSVRDTHVVKKSNRVKYRCPECGNQVWGKPGLRIHCGEDACEVAAYRPCR